jgi:hypothetical protein
VAENHPTYKKLPGRVAGPVFGITRLWYCPDHLISVSSAFGYENYQRVYFRDVEAFVVRRTNVRLIWNIVFAVVLASAAALVTMLSIFQGGSSPADAGFHAVMLGIVGVPATLALIALLINTFKGATCTFWVQTAGGTMRLGAPVRVRVAHKVLNVIAPLVVQAQSKPQVNTVTAP